MIEIGPVTPALRRHVVEDGWLDYAPCNRLRGMKKGLEGAVEATLKFLEEDEAGSVLGVYRESVPAGMLILEQFPEHSRTIGIFPYIAKVHRKQGVGTEAMQKFLGRTFSGDEFFRVECDLIKVRWGYQRARGFLKSLGFVQEGYKRWAWWLNGHEGYDVAIMTMTAPGYRRQMKEQEVA